MYSGGAWTDWYTLAYTKGELIQKFQQVLKGSMNNGMLILKREYLGLPFALDVKGGEWFGVVAIKSKGGDCWPYDACVVLDGNPLIEDHLTYIYLDEYTEEISDVTECMGCRTTKRNQMIDLSVKS